MRNLRPMSAASLVLGLACAASARLELRTVEVHLPDPGQAVVSTSYYPAGKGWSVLQEPLILTRFDSAGNVVWSKTRSDNRMLAKQMKPTLDGGLAVLATYGYRTALLRLSIDGDLIQETISDPLFDESVLDFAQTTDSGFVFGIGRLDDRPASLVKYGKDGTLLWGRKLEGFLYTKPASIKSTPDGGCILAGEGARPGSPVHALLAKMDAQGNTQWVQEFYSQGSAEWTMGYDVDLTPDGGYVIVGTADGHASLAKTDGAGEILWQRMDPLNSEPHAWTRVVATQLGYLLRGGGRSDIVSVAKADSAGEFREGTGFYWGRQLDFSRAGADKAGFCYQVSESTPPTTFCAIAEDVDPQPPAP